MGIVIQEDQAKELLDLTRENNRMLKDMRRSAFIGGVLNFVWWVLIIVVIPYFSWLFIQPYLESFMGSYNDAKGKAASVQTQASTELTQIQNLLKQFGLGGSN